MQAEEVSFGFGVRAVPGRFVSFSFDSRGDSSIDSTRACG